MVSGNDVNASVAAGHQRILLVFEELISTKFNEPLLTGSLGGCITAQAVDPHACRGSDRRQNIRYPQEFCWPKSLAKCGGRRCGVTTSEGRDQDVQGEAAES